MKTMKIEKQLLFTDAVKTVLGLQVNDGLQYHKETAGIRAMGPLFIKGQYENQEGVVQSFQEVLDMDILAPEHKLNGKDFFIQVEAFDGIAQDEGIQLCVTMSIHGLKEEEVRGEVSKKDMVEQVEIPVPIALQEVIQPVKESAKVMSPSVVEEPAKVETIPPLETFSEFEDLFEDADTTYTSYRMIVAKPDDSYESIAKRYDVDLMALRTNNHDKAIQAKTLIILP